MHETGPASADRPKMACLLPLRMVPMRALLLNYEYPPIGGGAGITTQALARGLAARGVTVDVVTASSSATSRIDPRRASSRRNSSRRVSTLLLFTIAEQCVQHSHVDMEGVALVR